MKPTKKHIGLRVRLRCSCKGGFCHGEREGTLWEVRPRRVILVAGAAELLYDRREVEILEVLA